MGSIVLFTPRYGGTAKRCLGGDVSGRRGLSGGAEEVNAMPMDAKNVRENLKKTALEINLRRGVL